MKKLIALCLVGVMAFGFTPIKAEQQSIQDSPYGLAPINDEKVIEMLKESGEIPQNASYEEAMAIVGRVVREQEQQFAGENMFAKEMKRSAKIKLENTYNATNIFNGNGNHLGKTTRNLPGVVPEKYTGAVRTDKVLALLIDFPDYKATDIVSDDTDMFYEEYTKKHYEDMLFSSTGYKGPKGENLISMKQYYEAQSGGSYTVEGSVYGWYTAKNNAAYYGGKDGSSKDANARALAREAIRAFAKSVPATELAKYDIEDRYDLDGDGDYREPDGMIDHLMIFHSSVGEEAGGGQLKTDAIWSHRWNMGVAGLGVPTPAGLYFSQYVAYDYTIQPADGAAGVCAHEYGHDLGLPDEYDTIYSGKGEPVSYWSLMSSGSWVGKIAGTEPSGFSPWAKLFFQANMGGNWLSGKEINLEDLNKGAATFTLDQASTKGTNNDVVKINLPNKLTNIVTPVSGSKVYHSTADNNLHTMLSTDVDLTAATNASFNFKANYNIEADWDGAIVYAEVDGVKTALAGSITMEHPTGLEGNLATWGWAKNTPVINGASKGWKDASFDLSAFAGKKIKVVVEYNTDAYSVEYGLYMDDLAVVVDGKTVLADNAEGPALVALNGFVQDTGIVSTKHFYLAEWRNHQGVDAGLGRIPRGDGFMQFEEGLLLWYADEKYDNNHTGVHPGEGFLGVVDADQDGLVWDDGNTASTRYQVHDATFSLVKNDKMAFAYPDFAMKDYKAKFNTEFDDSKNYSNPVLPDAGRNVPNYGLKIKVIGESSDRSVGQIIVGK